MDDEAFFNELQPIETSALFFDELSAMSSSTAVASGSNQSSNSVQIGLLQTTLNDHETRISRLEGKLQHPATLTIKTMASSLSSNKQLRTTTSSSPPHSTLSPNSPMSHGVTTTSSLNSSSTTVPNQLLSSSSTTIVSAIPNQAGWPCVVAGCANRTGFGANYHPKDIARHVKSRSHVEALLGFASYGAPTDVQFCFCGNEARLVAIDLIQSLGTQRNEGIADFFSACTQQQVCLNKPCLRLHRGASNGEMLVEAQRRAKEFLVSAALTEDRARKRRRAATGRKRGAAALLSGATTTTTTARRATKTTGDDDGDDDDDNDAAATAAAAAEFDNDDGVLRGDQTVAIEFGRRFSTPGQCYIVLDQAKNQLLVQLERPSRSSTMFHVAHVARMHRWMEKVIHYAPNRHEFWNTHVAVADAGFVDAFVLVHPNVPVRPNAETGDIDAQTRQQIQEHIACDEWLLCAGRSDGWLELIRREDLSSSADLIPLPLSHLQPHNVRLYDSAARPSLMLMSTHAPAPLHQQQQSPHSSSQFDVRMQHYLPSEVRSTSVKLEMLCKCSGWHLVAHRPSKLAPSALSEYHDLLAEQHSNAAAALQSFDALLELDAATRVAAEAVAARARAIACIAESDAMRRSNGELRRRLASVEKQIDERVATETAAIKAQNEKLQQQLVDLKKRYRESKSINNNNNNNVDSNTPTTTTNNNNSSSNKHHDEKPVPTITTPKSQQTPMPNSDKMFAPQQLTSQKQINQWMNEHPDRQFVFYRRHANNHNANNGNTNTNTNTNSPNNSIDSGMRVALCVRTAANELVHSRIKHTTSGVYCCVREVCAGSLDELLLLLQLNSASPTITTTTTN